MPRGRTLIASALSFDGHTMNFRKSSLPDFAEVIRLSLALVLQE
jgi:hypothetical protein